LTCKTNAQKANVKTVDIDPKQEQHEIRKPKEIGLPTFEKRDDLPGLDPGTSVKLAYGLARR
jgi:hypothetical protein